MTMSPANNGPTPSIRIYDSHYYSLPHHPRPPFPSTASPMAIPRARQEAAPPALPPPRYLGNLPNGPDPGWQWSNTNSATDTGFTGNGLTNIKPGSSLYGASIGSQQPIRKASVDHIVTKGFDPPNSTSWDDVSSEHSGEHNSDQDRKPNSRPSLGNHRFMSEPRFQRDAYDRQLLSKIGGPNPPTRTSPSASSSSVLDSATPTLTKLNGQLKPLSVPDRLHSSPDSPAPKWSALSPGQSVFRSQIFDSPSAESHRARFGSISTPGPLDEIPSHHRGSYDHNSFSDPDFGMDENGMRELDIQDRTHAESENYQPGSKRRASSPPSEATREDRPTTGGRNDLYHRRSAQMLINRNPSSSRVPPSSFSSVASVGQRANSMGSSYGFSTAPSSMTSCGGDQRLSPSALPPHPEKDLGSGSPYAHTRSLDPSPRSSLSRPQHQKHSRGFSETETPQIRKLSAETMLRSRQSSITNRIPGAYMCECCPKKPKKFDNEEDLRLHELEKQYICQYCKNRFKNKNEAERHQNSLHLRTHSWSCATLAGPDAAFHPSTTLLSELDVCGYCGEEFPSPADWEARSAHLTSVHKFGECNQAKKFWRADHFRQHLKHSHAGTSGKWTNVLENACMREEPQPERIGSEGSISGPSTGSLVPKPGVVNEA